MWTIAAANKKIDGPLGSYSGLTDVHLAHYFSTPSKQSHLKAAKLIKNDGTIIPGEKVKMATLQYEKKKKLYDILASTVIQNAAHKESSWNKKLCSYLEDILKMENVEAMKGGYKKNLGIRGNNRTIKGFSTVIPHQSYNVFDHQKNQQCEKGCSTLPRLARSACKCSFNRHFNIANLKRSFSSIETSPYASLCGSHECKLNDGLQQIILLKKKKKRRRKNLLRVQPKTSTSGFTAISKVNKLSIPDQNFTLDQCKISLYYYGHTPLTNSSMHITEEVLIRQQHCGGTSVVVYKGKIAPKEILTFTSLIHHEHSFSITLFLDGIRYLKLSSCCVFRYSPGKRLGGTSGIFSINNIQGGKPCVKCQYRQIELSNEGMKTKGIYSENTVIQPEKGAITSTNLHDEVNKTSSALENSVFDETKYQKNHIETEESDSSIVSEIINCQVEELKNGFNNGEIENEVIEDEEILEDTNSASINEDDNDSSEINSDSENASSIAESVKNLVRPEIKPYTSESSDDEDGGKQHVVLVSVHGTPSRSA